MSCWQTVQDYAFRSLGYGERLLPRPLNHATAETDLVRHVRTLHHRH